MRRRTTGHNSRISIEMLCNLLQRRIPSLDIEEPDNGKLNTEPCAVEDVVLPSKMLQGDGVDVLVEEQREVNAEEHDRQTLGADVVGEDFSSVTEEKTRPGTVVTEVVQEDHGDDGVGSGFVAVHDIAC